MQFLDSKMAKANGALIAVIALVAALFYFGGGVPQSASPDGANAPAPSNTVTVVGAPCTQGTSLTSSVVRRYTDVAQTAENVTILQNGVLKSTTAHGSSVTVQSGSNGDMLDLYAGLQSTTFYARHLQGKLEVCTSSATTGDPAFKEVDDATVGGDKIKYAESSGLYAASPNKLVQIDTAPTITITNDGQADKNTGGQGQSDGANLTIGAGGTGSVTVKISPTINTGWGVNGNVLACQFPSAVYDTQNPVIPTLAGAGVLAESGVKPSLITYPLIGANNTVKAWKYPAIDGRKTGDMLLSLKMTADVNHNPAGALDRINCTIADTNYYQKQNTGEYVLDIENRDTNVDLGGGVSIYDFEVGVA